MEEGGFDYIIGKYVQRLTTNNMFRMHARRTDEYVNMRALCPYFVFDSSSFCAFASFFISHVSPWAALPGTHASPSKQFEFRIL